MDLRLQFLDGHPVRERQCRPHTLDRDVEFLCTTPRVTAGAVTQGRPVEQPRDATATTVPRAANTSYTARRNLPMSWYTGMAEASDAGNAGCEGAERTCGMTAVR